MIITEKVTLNDKEFIYNYSDEGFYMQKQGTDEVYSDAYDLLDSNYTYVETDIPIESEAEKPEVID